MVFDGDHLMVGVGQAKDPFPMAQWRSNKPKLPIFYLFIFHELHITDNAVFIANQ